MNNLITPEVLDKLKSTSYPFTPAPEHWEPSEVFVFAGTHYLIPSVYEVKTYLGGASINIELSLEGQWSFTIFFGITNQVYNSTFRYSDYINTLNTALETALDMAFEHREYCKLLRTPVTPERASAIATHAYKRSRASVEYYSTHTGEDKIEHFEAGARWMVGPIIEWIHRNAEQYGIEQTEKFIKDLTEYFE